MFVGAWGQFCPIDRHRAELTQEALLLGGRFFQETPGRFARQLKGYWKIWRRQPEPQTSM